MTAWEQKSSNTSHLSALPLAWMFGYAPLSFIVGGITGGLVGSTLIPSIATGMAIGVSGSLGLTLGYFIYGHSRAKFAHIKHRMRVKRLTSQKQNQCSNDTPKLKKRWSFKNKFSYRFNKTSFQTSAPHFGSKKSNYIPNHNATTPS